MLATIVRAWLPSLFAGFIGRAVAVGLLSPRADPFCAQDGL
jgi:hypothetical protein